MAVPAEIRAVPRPVNTIVDDSGTNSPKRYAVRQRASSKYIPGGNPQPKNGKVIGHIIDYKYVPLTDSTASDGPDMLSYGASALVKSVSADLLSDLLNIYPANEAYSIMSIATLRVIRPKITLGRMVPITVEHSSARIIPALPCQRILWEICFSVSDRTETSGRTSISCVFHLLPKIIISPSMER